MKIKMRVDIPEDKRQEFITLINPLPKLIKFLNEDENK